MKRKFLCLILIIQAALGCLALSVSAAPAIPALSVLANDLSLAKCGLVGHELSFERSDFDTLTQSEIDSITILTLPAPESGSLYLSGLPVQRFDKISANDLDKLSFRSACDQENACSFSFRQESPHGNYQATCRLYMLDRLNFAPTFAESDAEGNTIGCTTYQGIMTNGTLLATDPEGDTVHFEIVSYPEKGTVSLNGNEYSYTAFAGSVGEDSFSVVAVDRYGNRSESTEIGVTVLKRENNLSYADMEGHEAYFAALTMSYCGAISGSVIGGEAVFMPDDTISYAEFVAALTTALGLESADMDPANPSLDVPTHLLPSVHTALANGWIDETSVESISFGSPICRADAAKILCTAMNVSCEPIPGVTAEEQALILMANRDILSLENGALCPEAPLTRASAAMAICALLDRM